jgi:hypothetical protein
MSGRWVGLREAAELLDTSTEAVRKRAARGSLRSDRQDGRVLVWVDEGRTEGGREAQVDREALLEAKDETIRLLEEQLRLRAEEIQRRDVIISQLTQATSNLTDRLRELEAPASQPAPSQEPPVGPESVAEGPERGEPRSTSTGGPQEGTEERPPDTAEWPVRGGLLRPWWRRMFSG